MQDDNIEQGTLIGVILPKEKNMEAHFRVFKAERRETWSRSYFNSDRDMYRLILSEEVDELNNKIGMAMGLRTSKAVKTGDGVCQYVYKYQKILVNKKLYWINEKLLQPVPQSD